MGVYSVLVEDQLKMRPPLGFIMCGDGMRHRIENNALPKSWVLELASSIREARKNVGVNPVHADARPMPTVRPASTTGAQLELGKSETRFAPSTETNCAPVSLL
jgi:hypothetical protein